jgi:hypothetical protein
LLICIDEVSCHAGACAVKRVGIMLAQLDAAKILLNTPYIDLAVLYRQRGRLSLDTPCIVPDL